MENLIDQNLCKKCKLCMEVCPTNIITNGDGLNFIEENLHICLKCAQCMAVCSTKAIHIEGISYENDLFDLPEQSVDYKNFKNFTANRRSVRNFKDKAVPEEIIDDILKTIEFAPFGSHPEKMHVTVVNNRQLIEEQLPAMSQFLDNVVKWIESPFFSRIIRLKKGKET